MRSIEEWILAATGHIRFPPDRKAVAEEIRASYEDHRDALLAAGETRDRASFLALCLNNIDYYTQVYPIRQHLFETFF